MVIETDPMMHWTEPKLVLSPTETFKACALGGVMFEEFLLTDIWYQSRTNPVLLAHMHDAAAFGLHSMLSSVPFEHLYTNPSPFIRKVDL